MFTQEKNKVRFKDKLKKSILHKSTKIIRKVPSEKQTHKISANSSSLSKPHNSNYQSHSKKEVMVGNIETPEENYYLQRKISNNYIKVKLTDFLFSPSLLLFIIYLNFKKINYHKMKGKRTKKYKLNE